MSAEEEAVWWETHDTADYLGEFEFVEFRYEPEGEKVVKAKTQTLNMTIDENSLGQLRAIAKSMGIGYSTLARVWVLEKLHTLQKRASTGQKT